MAPPPPDDPPVLGVELVLGVLDCALAAGVEPLLGVEALTGFG